MAKPTSKRERVFTGIAVVLILALALWLLLGRSPGARKRVEVPMGGTVETDRGTVTVRFLESFDEGAPEAPKSEPGHTVQAIRFHSCRSEPGGAVVDMALFSVLNANGTSVPAAGSSLSDNSGDCVSGQVFVQIPFGSTPTAIQYDADPVGVWRIPED